MPLRPSLCNEKLAKMVVLLSDLRGLSALTLVLFNLALMVVLLWGLRWLLDVPVQNESDMAIEPVLVHEETNVSESESARPLSLPKSRADKRASAAILKDEEQANAEPPRFAKVSSAGQVLEPEEGTWRCVLDRTTRLMWEVKTNNGGWRDREYTYSWYQSNDSLSSGRSDGGNCLLIDCDTQAYVNQVNAEGLCGVAGSWRLPSQKELQSLDHPTRFNPDAYTDYFPFVMSAQYWSASQSDYSATLAWSVDFANGISYVSEKRLSRHVRVVTGPLPLVKEH